MKFTSSLSVSVEPEFSFESQEYRELYNAELSQKTAFQAPIWMAMLHGNLCRSLGAVQRTVTVRAASDGKLVAILPLVLQRTGGLSMLQPADFGLSDYNGMIGDPQVFSELAADARLRRDLRSSLGAADLLMFRKRREGSFEVDRLFDGMRQSIGENAAYACHLGDDFDLWGRRVLDRGFTKELGRLQRQAERNQGPYVHRALTEEAEIRSAFEFLRETHRHRHTDSVLERPEYFSFYSDYAVAAVRAGEAAMYASHLNDRPVAALFGLTGDGDFHATLIGVDTARYPKLSAGMQILYRVMEMRHRDGHRMFDMCLGDPGYKTHFRPVVTPVYNLTLSVSLKGAAIAAIYHHAKPVKNFLRKRMANVR